MLILLLVSGAFAADTVLLEQSANGSRTLKPFTSSTPWEIRWESNAPMFSVFLFDKQGEPLGQVASQTKPGSGTSYYAKPGTYILKINSGADWKITVVQAP